MLLFFAVENFKSISEKQKLSMFPIENEKSAFSSETGNRYFPFSSNSAAIFGANAAGKSSFIESIDVFQDILIGARETTLGDELNVTPFILNNSWKNKPTEFEIGFIMEGVYYEYGLNLNRKQVMEEWLFTREDMPNVRTKKLFHRAYSEEHNRYFWQFSPSLKSKDKNYLETRVRENQIALSKAVKDNIEDFNKPFQWITQYLRVFKDGGTFAPIYTADVCENGNINSVLEFIKHADLDIIDFKTNRKPINIPDFLKSIPNDEQEQFIERYKNILTLEISTVHKDVDGNLVEIDLEDESSGTKLLFGFAGPFIETIEQGYTFIIDELNTHLHPLALEYVVSNFNDLGNKSGAQLVFTSHDTTIMNSEKLSRDQVWFIDKSNVNKNSVIYPLSDFATRSATKFQKPYLEGRFGAIPKIEY